jgi:hypothetical protein
MDRIISFFLFAAFFYFLMRFGCGAQMVHGHHHHEGHHATAGSGGAGSSKDPVCGMEVVAGSRLFRGLRGSRVPILFAKMSRQTNPSNSLTRRRSG